MKNCELLPPYIYQTETVEAALASWNLRYGQLSDFKEAHGHCRISGRSISVWIGQQSMAYRAGHLADAKTTLLNSLGFDWNVRNTLND